MKNKTSPARAFAALTSGSSSGESGGGVEGVELIGRQNSNAPGPSHEKLCTHEEPYECAVRPRTKIFVLGASAINPPLPSGPLSVQMYRSLGFSLRVHDMSTAYPLFSERPDHQPKVLSVTQLSQLIEGTLESAFQSLWVSGEISEVSRPHSGHVYFTLRDETAQIRAVIWRSVASRLRFQLEEGQQVICHGDIDVYPPRGTYQLVVQQVEPQGAGALQLAFKQLLRRLEAEGLFEPARKRPLPAFPRRVGFVTSPSGAAIHDFLQVAARRFRGVSVLVIPARVQGEGAAGELARGIALANRLRPPLDVLVVGRGGGSLEDLWSFNEEVVVRAIVASKIPVVSAVGHETDITLADLAADVRAPDAQRGGGANYSVGGRIDQPPGDHSATTGFDAPFASHRGPPPCRAIEPLALLRNPRSLIYDLSHRLDELDLQASRAICRRLKSSREQLASIACRADALSPLAVLARGYSVTTDAKNERVITSTELAYVGQILKTRIHSGAIISRVDEVHNPVEFASHPDNN